jgi:hypothetical protein
MNAPSQTEFLEFMRNEYPVDEFRWSRMSILRRFDAVCLSYGIEPSRSDFIGGPYEHLLHHGDIYGLFHLIEDAIQSGNLSTVDRFGNIDARAYVEWAEKVKIPIETRYFKTESKDISDNSSIASAKQSSRQSRPESFRKEWARQIAERVWQDETRKIADQSNKLKKYTSPTELARSKSMKKIIEGVNELLGLEPIQGDAYSNSPVDPEWFSDLYPGEKKPGPKRSKE